MIDDKALIQPFATVLTGILIFLTLERSFKWQSSIEERMATYVDLAKKASQSIMNSYDVISELEVERTRIIERYKSEEQRVQRRDEINIRIKEQQLILAKSKKDYNTFTKAVESLTTKRERHKIINKIQHGILIAMMSLISGSIILIIFLPQTLISSLMFSAGVVLLIVRVWMHYID
ncbi:MAG TPA: hypothetical protein VH796_14305 [Nitrososphaeraceae archaeon]|jgi:BioD-like phosphotransacetylase family protein